MRALTALAISFLLPTALRAHGDVHEEIAALTTQIEATPLLPLLFLRRGQLHRTHRDWTAAEADFQKARELDPALFATDLALGETLMDAGRPSEAIAAFDRYISQRPEHSAGYAGRARAEAAAMQWEPAAEDFARAIAHDEQPEPELFAAQSRALQAAGKIEEAIRVLDDGISRLGPIVTLTQPAVELEAEAGHLDPALARLAKILAAAPRKERWLLRRGELLEKAGRIAEAREAFAQAQSALAEISADRRQTAAMLGLAALIEAALARVATR